MHGAIAAGSETTADAGAAILAAGGNAVDAAVAACFATAAGEPTLTSLAGGGVLLVRDGRSGAVEICDFFANAPGLGGEGSEPLDFYAMELDFGPARQCFHIGAGSAAVPGAIPGLCTALERWGSLPLEEVVRPACHALREGVVLGPWQARAAAVLEPILLRSEAGRRQFGVDGRLLGRDDLYRLPELADVLEELARKGWRSAYCDLLGTALVEQFGPGAGGLISSADVERYRVEIRQPLRVGFHGAEVFTNPPPAAGGSMIAFMLRLLESERWVDGTLEQVHALCRAMAVADEARRTLGGDELGTPSARWVNHFRELAGRPLQGVSPCEGGPASTTHISVVDAEGNAAAVTTSHGEGNGILIDGTGIMMNNLMGEEDLFPGGFHSWEPGARLSTMMSPTAVLQADGTVTLLGSGGANRIRTALTQVIVHLVDARMDPRRAVEFPRVHFEGGVLNAEVFGREGDAAALEDLDAPQLVRFEEPNLFFGGVHLVQRRGDGSLAGAGDPRRGGVCRIV